MFEDPFRRLRHGSVVPIINNQVEEDFDMDIKAKIEEIVAKVKNDPQFAENFKNDPVKAVEAVIGVDLPDDIVEKVTSGAKAALTADKANDLLGGFKKLF